MGVVHQDGADWSVEDGPWRHTDGLLVLLVFTVFFSVFTAV